MLYVGSSGYRRWAYDNDSVEFDAVRVDCFQRNIWQSAGAKCARSKQPGADSSRVGNAVYCARLPSGCAIRNGLSSINAAAGTIRAQYQHVSTALFNRERGTGSAPGFTRASCLSQHIQSSTDRLVPGCWRTIWFACRHRVDLAGLFIVAVKRLDNAVNSNVGIHGAQALEAYVLAASA